MNDTQPAEPGWYPFPDGSTRYFDGNDWAGQAVLSWHRMPQPTPPKPFRGLAVTSLCVGIVGALFGLIPILGYFAVVLGVLGVVFGLLGRKHGIGKAGVALSVVAVTLGIIGCVIVANAVDHATECIDSIQVQDDGSVTTADGC